MKIIQSARIRQTVSPIINFYISMVHNFTVNLNHIIDKILNSDLFTLQNILNIVST